MQTNASQNTSVFAGRPANRHGAFPFDKATTLFFGALALVTALPLFGLGIGLGLAHPNEPRSPLMLAALAPIIGATGLGHVASTAYFYTDRGFWQLIGQNRTRFFVLPAAAVVAWLIAARLGSEAAGLMTLLFFVWQLYHYQKQNYGVVAFAAQGRKLGALPASVKTVLDLSVAGGICTLMAHHEWLGLPVFRFVGIALFAASTLVFVHLLIYNRRVTSDPLVILFTAFGWAFFFPTLLSQDILVSFQSYAIAHGAQYLLFMSVVSGGSKARRFGPLIMALTASVVWLLFSRLVTNLQGLEVYQGITMGHFIVDAKLWRMRDAMQRRLIGERFRFLFRQADAT